jgi:hypothetical protein
MLQSVRQGERHSQHEPYSRGGILGTLDRLCSTRAGK